MCSCKAHDSVPSKCVGKFPVDSKKVNSLRAEFFGCGGWLSWFKTLASAPLLALGTGFSVLYGSSNEVASSVSMPSGTLSLVVSIPSNAVWLLRIRLAAKKYDDGRLLSFRGEAPSAGASSLLSSSVSG